MGTDIHLFVEARKEGDWKDGKRGRPGPWEVALWERNKYHEKYPDEEPDLWQPDQYLCFHDRNYRVFAMLADVRNGSGFAGIDTGEAVEPVAMPRGLPKDVTPEVKKKIEDAGYHTPSWLTLGELRAYIKKAEKEKRTVVQRGVIPLYSGGTGPLDHEGVGYKEWRTSLPLKSPRSWSGAISGENIVTVDMHTAERILRGEVSEVEYLPATFGRSGPSGKMLKVPDEKRAKTLGSGGDGWARVYVRIEWTERYVDLFRPFIERAMPILEAVRDKWGWWEYREEDHGDKVRAVFAFDS